MSKIIYMFILSMLPVLEIRGSMIYALANNINQALAFGLSVIGNILPIPFLILLTQKVLQWLDTIDTFKPFVDWINKKAQEKSKTIDKYGRLGLYILVAIPLPGTGAWTGALVASFLGLSPKKSMLPITLGVITAGTIVMLSTMGVLNVIK
ncbi:MAG: small multi-drug export protein [Finegoldia magna]|uniref:COG2426 family protein n=1 Tax=Finegoldia magna TaxID=1260 RepID=UPI00290F8333|nr:small multi-drug export protein [Finegoldia magna]MDU5273038.1 small multi-drug export protein [Finegoldia magna]